MWSARKGWMLPATVRYVIGSNYGKGEDKKTSWFRVASFVQGPQKEFLMGVPKG